MSQDAADNAKNAYDQAQAQIAFDEATIEQRQAQLDAAQVNLGYTNIISPVNGTVVSRNVTMGQTVAASFQTPTLFLIATDLTKMQVDTNVSESDIGGIKEGDKATFTVDAFPKRTFEGRVTQVRQSPQTVQNVVTYDVVVGVDNTDLALKPGMTAATRDRHRRAQRRRCACRTRRLRYAPRPRGSQSAGGAHRGRSIRRRRRQAGAHLGAARRPAGRGPGRGRARRRQLHRDRRGRPQAGRSGDHRASSAQHGASPGCRVPRF